MTPAKRIFDITFALVLIALVALPMALLLLWLWAREGRPLFHVAERMKTPDRRFRFWKLRTMRVSATDAGVSGGDKAARITPTGRILRRTRLDELPQLWNILRGDMSFVGPRPPLPVYVERFPELYAEVLKARPGVTGLATVVFHAHEERILAPCRTAAETDRVYARRCVPRKARLDILYRDRRNMRIDLWLIWLTLARVFGLPDGRGRSRLARMLRKTGRSAAG